MTEKADNATNIEEKSKKSTELDVSGEIAPPLISSDNGKNTTMFHANTF